MTLPRKMRRHDIDVAIEIEELVLDEILKNPKWAMHSKAHELETAFFSSAYRLEALNDIRDILGD